MPWGDRTGPAGMGPMTGRGAGYCAGYGVPGYANPISGRGFGGRGGGWGWRNQYYATGLTGWQRAGLYPGNAGYVPGSYRGNYPYGTPGVNKQQELDALKGQAEYFEDALDGINKKIAELEAQLNKEGEK